MRYSKHYIMVLLACVALAPFVIASCQSVATTSAKLRNQEGNYDLAIQLARQGLAENPNDPEAYFQLGVSYSQLDSVALAYDCFVKARDLDPKKKQDVENNIQHNFAKHHKLGQGAFNRNDFVGAAREFELATKADPTQEIGYLALGVTCSRLGRDVDSTYYERAVVALDKVLELSNPSESDYINALELTGKALIALGREGEAETRFRRLIEDDPTSFGVIENIGNEMLTEEKWSAAAVFLKMAATARAKIGSEDFNLYYNLGAALYNLREQNPANIDEAITYYEKALELQTDEPQTIFNIFVAYVAKEDYSNAVGWGEKYVDVSPTDAKGWKLLARCYSEVGEKDKARDAVGRYEQLQGAGGQ